MNTNVLKFHVAATKTKPYVCIEKTFSCIVSIVTTDLICVLMKSFLATTKNMRSATLKIKIQKTITILRIFIQSIII